MSKKVKKIRNRGKGSNPLNLEIVFHPDPILKMKSEKIPQVTKQVRQLIQGMFYICQRKKSGFDQGIGLAAVQVAFPYRLIIINAPNLKLSMINPVIIHTSEKKDWGKESSLSFPGKIVNVERFSAVVVEYNTATGERTKAALSGLWARIAQHTIDQINGITILDHEKNLFNGLKNVLSS